MTPGGPALDRVCAEVGFPKAISVDQGAEFVSRDLDLWAYNLGVTLDFSRPGKLTDRHRSFRRSPPGRAPERRWFLTLADTAEQSEAWRNCYDEVRPQRRPM